MICYGDNKIRISIKIYLTNRKTRKMMLSIKPGIRPDIDILASLLLIFPISYYNLSKEVYHAR